MTSTPNILCDAVAFGYGPIGKLLTVQNHLPKHYKLTLLATRGSYELGKLSSFDSVILCDTEEPKELESVRAKFLAADLFINIMNPVSAEYAQSLHVPMIHIDSLFWMWDNLADSLARADRYFIQGFDGVDRQLSKLAVTAPCIVGAIVDHAFKSDSKGNQLLVNFGGTRSRLIQPGVNSNYSTVVAKILETALQKHQFERVLFTGDARTMSLLADTVSVPKCSFGSLSHDKFLAELNQSALLITSPGLTTTYEAFAYSIPVAFLPPQNFSQFLILKRLRKKGAAPYSFHWLDFYPEMDMDVGIPELTGVERVLSCINRFERDSRAQSFLRHVLVEAVSLKLDDLERLTALQRTFIEIYGSDGANEIANEIKKICN